MPEDLLKTFLPYCLDRQPDGRYAVLNRRYKPVGMTVPFATWVKYEDHPCLVALKGLTPKVAQSFAVNWAGDMARMYLYDDGSVPTDTPENWDAYAKRLQVVGRLKVG